jgi:prolyl oligopeptidase
VKRSGAIAALAALGARVSAVFTASMASVAVVAVVAVVALAAPLAAAAQPLPVAPVRDVPEVFFGTTVHDPYRAFENPKAPAVAAWMRAHSDHAHRTLRARPGRAALRAALDRYDAGPPAHVGSVVRRPLAEGRIADASVAGGREGAAVERLFYLKRSAAESQFRLMRRDGADGAETLVFDPARLDRAGRAEKHAINWFEPSPDGRHVAIGVSAGGSEAASLWVIDVESGRRLGTPVTRADHAAPAWSPDGSELWFNRLQPLPRGAPETERYQRSHLVAWRPGVEPRPRFVLRAGPTTAERAAGVPAIDARESPVLAVQPDGTVLLLAIDGVASEVAAWWSTLDALRAGRPAWRPLVARDDGVTALAVRGGRVFALSHRDAPRYRLLEGPLEGFSVRAAAVRIAESAAGEGRVLVNLAAAADALYVEAREGNVKRLVRVPWEGGTPADVPLPVNGAFAFEAGHADLRLPGLLLDLQGWTVARRIFALDAAGRATDTGLQPPGPYDRPAGLATTEVLVPSHDGVRVPLSIVHREGVVLDGTNPVLLTGYAAYGITDEPFFSASRLAWLDAGGVYAVANPRGSGVFGRAWHLAGKEATKPNSWRDLIACAEWLVSQRWTTPARLAIEGGSAGGLLVGMAMVERPDLFAAVLVDVGALDMVRGELEPSGPPNIPEFGTRTHEAGFRALLAMSAYHQVRDGVRYPAVLLTHGVNDPRVAVSNSTKMAARLMAASASGQPVLLRLDWAGGHGIGDTRAQVLDQRADEFAFLMWRLGMAPPR